MTIEYERARDYLRDKGDGDLRNEITRLRKGIQEYLDGNYENARKHRHEDPQYRCEHGCHYWEDCGQCIDAHFQELLGTWPLTQ
jgi:hypothetical protein